MKVLKMTKKATTKRFEQKEHFMVAAGLDD